MTSRRKPTPRPGSTYKQRRARKPQSRPARKCLLADSRSTPGEQASRHRPLHIAQSRFPATCSGWCSISFPEAFAPRRPEHFTLPSQELRNTLGRAIIHFSRPNHRLKAAYSYMEQQVCTRALVVNCTYVHLKDCLSINRFSQREPLQARVKPARQHEGERP